MKRRWLVATAAVAATLLAACGDPIEPAESRAAPTPTTATQATTSSRPATSSTSSTSTTTTAAPVPSTTARPSAPETTAPAAPAAAAAQPPPPPAPPFTATVVPIDDATRARMTHSWRPGCPVPLEDLRLVTLSHWNDAGAVVRGELVVHADAADAIVAAFRRLYELRFPITRMELVDVYGGDDQASMRANNTSAFNCRTVAGTDRWSEHAYGRAVDVNPLVNPWVRNNAVDPPEGRPYADRRTRVPGGFYAGDPAVQAFLDVGWHWGGSWSGIKDYQHFSATGR
ncbi:MAG TPA: M15 family metallopeptidase [Acidimicrobiales bacterium]